MNWNKTCLTPLQLASSISDLFPGIELFETRSEGSRQASWSVSDLTVDVDQCIFLGGMRVCMLKFLQLPSLV